MALKVLLMRKERDTLNRELDGLKATRDGFEARESELAEAINELAPDASEEEKAAVDEAVEAFEKEKAETEEKITELEDRIAKIEEDIASEEEKQEPKDEPKPEPAPEEGKGENGERSKGGYNPMITRNKVFNGMKETEVHALMEREDTKAFLHNVRTALTEKRALSGAGLLVPEVFLGMIRENIEEYSKLYAHCNVRQLSGDGREVVMGTIPEAVWTDCCGTLNELDLAFNAQEIACWKVGGYFVVCNANIEDSDIDLAAELITALGQAIGYALDKAILFGLGTRMPLGVVTRLAQTSQPADYPADARPWVDLHTKNITKVNKTGVELFQAILTNAAAAKGKYSRGQRTWAMNETTYTKLKAEGLSINAAGAIVTGIEGTMPVAGGDVVVLDFLADGDIVYGYFDLYLLGERKEITIGQSEHVKFIEDKTVFKGTARYDGAPTIAEGFGMININNTNPTTTVTFAPDSANASE